MPELPEVESLRRYLISQRVPGHTIVAVEAKWPKTIKAPGRAEFTTGLAGRTVEDVQRRGKYLLLPLCAIDLDPLDSGSRESVAARSSRASVLVLHMGMTGSLTVMTPEDEPQRFAHTTFFLDDERRIELNDPRKWASIWLVEHADEVVGGLGPEPLDPDFTAADFARRVHGRRSPVKAVLMDQSVVAGVGNIYADEALLRAGISPFRRAHRISPTRLRALHAAVVETLRDATGYIVENAGEDGRPFVVDAHDDRMRITRRKGAPCPECGAPLRARALGNRTAYYCRNCQS